MTTEKKKISSWNSKEQLFLIGLRKLTIETGIAVGGCGCCGSPYLFNAEITSDKSGYGDKADTLGWIDPSDNYDWENYSQNIVK